MLLFHLSKLHVTWTSANKKPKYLTKLVEIE